MKKGQNRFYCDIMSLHNEVTGSCFLLIVKKPNEVTQKFVIDCGLFQEERYNELNRSFPFNPDEVDAVFVTHNHVDHTGRLPFLVKKGYDGPIYTTEPTAIFLPLALNDSQKVLRDTSKRQHREVLYSESDVDRTLKMVKPCEFGKPIQIAEGVRATFLKNGHLIGAASILLQLNCKGHDKINILFTGDYNNKNMFFNVNVIPKWVRELPLTIVQESTYGYMDSTETKECFKSNVLKCIKNGGTVVAPVFSLGRSQEILYEIKSMQESGELDEDIPIYFDGKLAIKYTNLYLNAELGINKKMKDFLPKNLTYVDKASREQVVNSRKCKIILTTSGMGSYGPAQIYIPAYISRENCLIHFTGYTAEGTMGNRLRTAQKGSVVEVGGLIVKKKADVEYTSEYSAHAKADEMINFLKQFTDVKLLLINHGATEVKQIFAERCVDEVNPCVTGIIDRERFYRLNGHGLVKTLSTKFE